MRIGGKVRRLLRLFNQSRDTRRFIWHKSSRGKRESAFATSPGKVLLLNRRWYDRPRGEVVVASVYRVDSKWSNQKDITALFQGHYSRLEIVRFSIRIVQIVPGDRVLLKNLRFDGLSGFKAEFDGFASRVTAAVFGPEAS